MDYGVEIWPLLAAGALLALAGLALWLFRRQVHRDRGDDAVRTERAIASARKAASRPKPARRPRRWVRARMQLAMLLTEGAGRRPDRDRFNEALEILETAIPVLRDEGLTPELATALYYKGRAQWGLGGLDPAGGMLEAAVETFRDLLTLEPWPRHLLRGVVVSLPALIMADLGDRKDDAALLEEAVALARDAVAQSRPRLPIDKSVAQRNLSHALSLLGRMTGDAERLEEAVEVARAAIDNARRNSFPGHWMACQANLGYALGALGMLKGDEALLEESLSVMENAGQAEGAKWRREGEVMLAQNAGWVRLALGRMRKDAAMLRRAAADLADSLEAYETLALPTGKAETARILGQTLSALSALENRGEYRARAADMFRLAETEFRHIGATRRAEEAAEDLRLLESPGGTDASTNPAGHRPLYIVR